MLTKISPLLCAFFIISSINAQSKLKQSKNEVSQGGNTSSHANISGERHSAPSGESVWEFDGTDNIFANLAGAIIVSATYYSAIGFYGGEFHLHNNLTQYPFYISREGNYTPRHEHSNAVKKWRVDITNNGLVSFDGTNGNHLNIKLRPIKYLFVSTTYRELWEKHKGKYEHLSLFNFSANYDRLRFKNFNLGYSIGFNYMANEVNKIGYALGFNFEAFPINRFSLMGNFNWGAINSQNIKTFETGLAYHINKYKITCGYQHMQIASPCYNFLTLGIGVYL